eukprot:Em0001g1287a
MQTPPCDGEGVPASSGNCGPYLQAFNFHPTSGVSDSCTTSQLHILVDPTLQSVKLMCTDLTSMPPVDTAAVTLRVISPPSPPSTVSSVQCTNLLTIQWVPATSGDNASSYTISVTNPTSETTVGVWSIGGGTTMMTIGNLVDSTNYTVNVTAINCAGPSNSSSISVQTLPCAPMDVHVITVLYWNNSVHDVELLWTHRQSCSVPQYTVVVTSGTSTDMSVVNASNCNIHSCSYIQSISRANISSYNVSVACRNRLSQIGQPYVTMQSVPTAVLKVSQFNANGEIATITCTFLDGSSHFCMVCCSTDPYVPFGLSGFGYFSSNNGPSVRVSLQGLSSNQTYYCKAAATNSNSNSCAGQVVGGVSLQKDDAVQITGIVVAVAVGTLILVALVLVIRVKSLHN